jgi:cytochrome c oxidase subunit 2
MTVFSRFGVARALLAALLAGTAGGAMAVQSRYNLQPPMTPIADEVYSLHNMMLIICTVIFVAVFSVMFYSIWKHRKSKGAVAANWHENTTVEIVWTVIPFIIVIVMALPATKTVVAMKDTSNAELTIKVTGSQWKWGYDYLRGEGEGISFLSQLATPVVQIEGREAKTATYLLEVDNPLVVPVNKKVRVIFTANDVIHAWWMPAFAIKQDAIPGFARDAWFRADRVGTFRGQCAELCGKDHAFMPIVVQVVSAEDYTQWVSGRKQQMAALADNPNRTWTMLELMARGEQVYQANCRLSPGQWPGCREFPALAGSKVVATRRPDCNPAARQERDAVVEGIVGRRTGRGRHLYEELVGQQGRRSPARGIQVRAQVIARQPSIQQEHQ